MIGPDTYPNCATFCTKPKKQHWCIICFSSKMYLNAAQKSLFIFTVSLIHITLTARDYWIGSSSKLITASPMRKIAFCCKRMPLSSGFRRNSIKRKVHVQFVKSHSFFNRLHKLLTVFWKMFSIMLQISTVIYLNTWKWLNLLLKILEEICNLQVIAEVFIHQKCFKVM